MKILVLGAAASGGLPRWNCACSQCQGLRQQAGEGAMTQSALAISADGQAWVLVNASPDIAAQIRANPVLQPGPDAGGSSPIKALVLLDSQLQSVAGLLSLRESRQLEVYATPMVFEDLTDGLPLLPVLEQYCAVRWHPLPVAGTQTAAEFSIPGFESLRFVALAVPGQRPPHARQREASVGDNIALWVQDLRGAQSLMFAPLLAAEPEAWGAEEAGTEGGTWQFWQRQADCWLLDAQAPEAWQARAAGRRILTRLGHAASGPQSQEQAALEQAFDGMVIEL
ncbi:pyrroloquinoline quinone biosynthesis protein B [Paucibacter sp. KBW04]|uniref:MBL fold metallo-hydrolase n=1 Tax=Paucibacter sp. KBW04 TaxID=2153361 RepID=UPI000F56F7CA|nr:MBL fold metallo-hydrolase [Paucibacter sp. KBW04]RQO63487.1 pyrroloquinoline quinone biosynthesis protein B [Paucibacter sp. KBW04]